VGRYPLHNHLVRAPGGRRTRPPDVAGLNIPATVNGGGGGDTILGGSDNDQLFGGTDFDSAYRDDGIDELDGIEQVLD
jgi:Ca2+-binding RTX toxin-like protein